MSLVNTLIETPLGYLMSLCYALIKNYGMSIILFTVVTKIILLPLSIWVHKNSIKMVKMQPEINFLKADHYGDLDFIADEQAKIFKREKYNPFASIIPLLIQIVLLMGLVGVIYNPLNYLLELPAQLIQELENVTVKLTGVDPMSSSLQLLVVDVIKNPELRQNFFTLQNKFPDVSIPAILDQIAGIKLVFLGFNLSWVPSSTKGIAFLVPVIAGFSSWLLCMIQNKISVLQSEQGRANKYGTMALSVGLSLYLGWFVPAGVALYWIASNTFAIIQLFILNYVISPKKYINYRELKKSKDALAAIEALQPQKRLFEKDLNAKREKADYKRFFSIANKHLVFYSEKNGFYKYFQNIIESLLVYSNITIHYITNDPVDAIFQLAKHQNRIKPYYIGEKKLITLMMKMDADMVVMTTPDLENYHLKRSYLRKDIEYVYVFHGVTSTNMCVRKGAYDNFDTVFCVGQHQVDELRETESIYNLPPKNLIPCGYGLLDSLIDAYKKAPEQHGEKKNILIAPSWQEGNILESCIHELVEQLLPLNYRIVIRPHPEFVKRYSAKMDQLLLRYRDMLCDDFIIETDFSSNVTIFTADLVITDWSGIAHEFAYTTKRPVLFIDTPMKVLNPDYTLYANQPLDISLRMQIGLSLGTGDMDQIAKTLEYLFLHQDEYKKQISEIVDKYIFYLGASGTVGAKYIISKLRKK